MAPEATEYRVVIEPEQAMALCEQHAGTGIESVVDAPRPLHGEALRIGIAARVHIGVAHLAPEMRRTLFHRAHEFWNAQRVGQPFEFDAMSVLEFEQPLVGDERIGALVIGVDSYARSIHGVPLFVGSVSAIRTEHGTMLHSKNLHSKNEQARSKNEWAPVHSSIAGPCIFVLAKDFW